MIHMNPSIWSSVCRYAYTFVCMWTHTLLANSYMRIRITRFMWLLSSTCTQHMYNNCYNDLLHARMFKWCMFAFHTQYDCVCCLCVCHNTTQKPNYKFQKLDLPTSNMLSLSSANVWISHMKTGHPMSNMQNWISNIQGLDIQYPISNIQVLDM